MSPCLFADTGRSYNVLSARRSLWLEVSGRRNRKRIWLTCCFGGLWCADVVVLVSVAWKLLNKAYCREQIEEGGGVKVKSWQEERSEPEIIGQHVHLQPHLQTPPSLPNLIAARLVIYLTHFTLL